MPTEKSAVGIDDRDPLNDDSPSFTRSPTQIHSACLFLQTLFEKDSAEAKSKPKVDRHTATFTYSPRSEDMTLQKRVRDRGFDMIGMVLLRRGFVLIVLCLSISVTEDTMEC